MEVKQIDENEEENSPDVLDDVRRATRPVLMQLRPSRWSPHDIRKFYVERLDQHDI